MVRMIIGALLRRRKPTEPLLLQLATLEGCLHAHETADHVGTVDGIEGDRIKLTKADSGEGSHQGHHHYIDGGLVATIEDGTVRLSANGDVAVTFEQEEA